MLPTGYARILVAQNITLPAAKIRYSKRPRKKNFGVSRSKTVENESKSDIRKKDKAFLNGLRDGLPIALGYFAVSFSLGIQAKDVGMNAFQAAVMSLTNLTSAGEFGALSIIGAGGSYLSIALSQLIINLRYCLMSFALSQKIRPETPTHHRLLMSYGITDEIFGVSIGQKYPLSPFYTYGALLLTVPGWTAGTAIGVLAGSILPDSVTSALNLALYGMFTAVFIPRSREDLRICAAVITSMTASLAATYLPYIKDIDSGSRIIILTVLISLIFAIIKPIDNESSDETDAGHTDSIKEEKEAGSTS